MLIHFLHILISGGTLGSPSSVVIPFEGTYTGTGLLTVQVVSAERIKDSRGNFVLYHIAISFDDGNEKTHGTIEKRYSDFEKLNGILRKRFSDLMEEVAFPGKIILGNFSDETIAKRSRAFEQYLTHLFSIDIIRFSEELKDFFYGRNLQDGYTNFDMEDYRSASACFEKCLSVQEKLLGNQHPDVLCTLSALVVCNYKTERRDVARKFAEAALDCLKNNEDNLLYLPLLKQCIYLNWMLGRDKSHLETKLSQMKDRGFKVEGGEDLRTVVINQYKSKSIWYSG
ncbi:hypothetical protein FSP39_006970 [Pinctada imbricata]|uniref:PX domain-containing protein n=1 Tax=Pinctada imbricata TaxID=66713 RepID=A0AA88XJU7_PINIB|nr:hypothetical protein FSP39_006970 [Pinctada imbricata]